MYLSLSDMYGTNMFTKHTEDMGVVCIKEWNVTFNGLRNQMGAKCRTLETWIRCIIIYLVQPNNQAGNPKDNTGQAGTKETCKQEQHAVNSTQRHNNLPSNKEH